MSVRKPLTPEEVAAISGHAERAICCLDCGAVAGTRCTRPGRGRKVHKSRFVAAAVELKHEARAAATTPEQAEADARLLASLPKVDPAEIEACRTEKGGYSFTKDQLAKWGVPWPPPAGWRRAITKGTS